MARKRIEPAYLWVPERTSSAGAEVVDLAASAGLILDAEQRLVVDALCSEKGNKWSALEAAIIEARQNGKTVDKQAIVLGDVYLFGARLVVWSAHLFTTTQEAHRDLVGLIDGTSHLSREVKKISYANGEEAIELVGDRRILFKARTKTGGRGLTGDRVILDEAWALGASEMGSLLPTLSARPNPGVIYGSSAGLVGSGLLRAIRDRGRPGGDPSLIYIEWCAPQKGDPPRHDGREPRACKAEECDHRSGTEGCVADDRKLWRLANPTLGRRISEDYVDAERRALPAEEFVRERLGWWDKPEGDGDGIPLDVWVARGNKRAKLADPVTLAVDAAPSQVSASIVACGGPIEVVEHRRGTSWVVERVKQLAEHGPSAIGLDPSGPAGALIPELEKAGFKVRSKTNPKGQLVLLDAREIVQACGALYADTIEGALVHRDQPVLNDAVEGAGRRQVGDAWKWSRRDSTVDISPLVAATVARFLWAQPEQAKTKPLVAVT